MSTNFSYTNPFVPIYCKGDDLSHAIIKPTIIYEEIAETKIEVSYMPAYKNQYELNFCRAFAVATLLQQLICKRFRTQDDGEPMDCKNPPEDISISYFGMLSQTDKTNGRTLLSLDDKVLSNPKRIYESLDLYKEIGFVFLESDICFDNVMKTLREKNPDGEFNIDKLFPYLKGIYETQKSTDKNNIADCYDCIVTITKYSGLKISLDDLKTALSKKTYEHFLYSIFFGNCKEKYFVPILHVYAYPDSTINASEIDIINKTIEGLEDNCPVLMQFICVSQDTGYKCKLGHAIVISGYKKVKNGKNIKQVFKVHNSWGEEWQKINNDGWVDANILINKL